MRWVAAVFGPIAGYYCITFPSCNWFWPERKGEATFPNDANWEKLTDLSSIRIRSAGDRMQAKTGTLTLWM